MSVSRLLDPQTQKVSSSFLDYQSLNSVVYSPLNGTNTQSVAGNIGEVKTMNLTSASAVVIPNVGANTSETFKLDLTPGKWLVYANITFFNAANNDFSPTLAFSLSTKKNTLGDNIMYFNQTLNADQQNLALLRYGDITPPFFVNTLVNQSVYVAYQAENIGVPVSVCGNIIAIRVA